MKRRSWEERFPALAFAAGCALMVLAVVLFYIVAIAATWSVPQ